MKIKVETKLYSEVGGFKSLLLGYIYTNGPVKWPTLWKEFQCSDSTVKRALQYLKKNGYLTKQNELTEYRRKKFHG